MVGYSYHHGQHAGHFNFNYSGLWPMFEFGADFNDRPQRRITYGDDISAPRDTVSLAQPSLDLMGAVYTKIDLSRGGWKTSVIPRVDLKWSNDNFLYGSELHPGFDIEAAVRYSSVLPKPKGAIIPRLGVGLEARGAYMKGAFPGAGKALYGYVYGYVPGFTKLQGFKLTASAQKRFDDVDAGTFMPSLAKVPRGYRSMPLNDYYKLTAEYAIPINLNDWEPVTILLYLMRINVVPFVDYAVNRGPAGVQQMASYGTVLTFQGHYFRLGPELNIGGRFSRYLDLDGTWRFRAEFVTSLGL